MTLGLQGVCRPTAALLLRACCGQEQSHHRACKRPNDGPAHLCWLGVHLLGQRRPLACAPSELACRL